MITYTQDISEIPWSSGIYILRNTTNNKVYIGSGGGRLGIRGRIRTHFWELRNNRHKNQHLQSSYNLYGKDSWEFAVLALCDKETCRRLEKEYTGKYKSYNQDKGYNKEGTLEDNTWWSEERRSKFKKLMTGRKLPKEWGAAISKGKKGKTPKFSKEEDRIKSLEGLKYGHTRESREKAKIAMMKIWEVIDPSNNRYTTTNMKEFCVDKNLRYNSMVLVANGYITNYRGWVCKVLPKGE